MKIVAAGWWPLVQPSPSKPRKNTPMNLPHNLVNGVGLGTGSNRATLLVAGVFTELLVTGFLTLRKGSLISSPKWPKPGKAKRFHVDSLGKRHWMLASPRESLCVPFCARKSDCDLGLWTRKLFSRIEPLKRPRRFWWVFFPGGINRCFSAKPGKTGGFCSEAKEKASINRRFSPEKPGKTRCFPFPYQIGGDGRALGHSEVKSRSMPCPGAANERTLVPGHVRWKTVAFCEALLKVTNF